MYFSSKIIADLVDYGAQHGLNKTKLEKELNLHAVLSQEHITYEQTVDGLNYISAELNDDCLGLHIGEEISLKVTAYVDSIMNNSATLEEAFENAVQYSKLISDALISRLEKNQQTYTVYFEETPDWAVQHKNGKKQIEDLTLLSALKSISAYTSKKYTPTSVTFSHKRPKNIHTYYRLFNCRMTFNQPQASIVFEKQIFDRSKKIIPKGLLESLKKKVEQEMQATSKNPKIIQQLKNCILNAKPDKISVREAAKQLHISQRTLQRKLEKHETTFKQIENNLQLKLARTYLKENEKNIDEISYLLGFSESSSFIRFFKQKTGTTPTNFKRNFPNLNL